MATEIKYIEVYTRNAKMMKLYGDKLTWVEKFINVRSNGLHMEIRFSDRYGGISASSTMQDGVNGFRFKMIGYSHGYRWDVIRIPVTAEQEARIWAKACEMADSTPEVNEGRIANQAMYLWYGPNHIKYDRRGVMYSFITKRRWWKPSKTKNWCNESVALCLMEVWPDLLTAYVLRDVPGKEHILYEPHALLPDETHYMIENYFRTLAA